MEKPGTHILHVVPSLDPAAGGVSQAVRNMIKYATRDGVTHEVVCLDNPDADYLYPAEFQIYPLGKGKTAWNYHTFLKTWLRSNLSNYTEVIVHGLWQYQSLAAVQTVISLKKTDLQLYVMPHGMMDPYFQKAKGRKLKALRNLLVWRLVERRLINTANALFFTCETERILAARPFRRYLPKEEHVIGLGVAHPPLFDEEMKACFNEVCPAAKGKKYLLFLGRIDSKKGVDLLISAYLQLRSKVDDLPLLVIAGPGLETDFGRQMVRNARSDENILFPGMLKGPVKWGAFYGCEAFVLPSHQENFGVAVVEALSCARPVLISDQVNIYSEIEKANAGLISKDTGAGVYEMLKKWASLTSDEKNIYGLNAKSCYETNYTEDVVGEFIFRVLKKIKS